MRKSTKTERESLSSMRAGTNRRRLLRLVSVNLLILFIFLELASVTAYFVKTGKFFYTRDRSSEGQQKQLGLNLDASRLNNTTQQQLHPYFGFIDRPGLYIPQIKQTTNNYGFAISQDYPLQKANRNEFFVGIFGGSVAQVFCFNEFEDHTLASALKQIPRLRQKEIVILPFAIGSYKEPQQLLILDYFLSIGQQLDMVINLDGVNEVAISFWNNSHNLEVSMPASYLVAPLAGLANKDLSTEELALTLELLQDRSRLKNLVDRLSSCRLATCYALTWLQLRYQARQHNIRLVKFNSLERHQHEDSIVRLNTLRDPLGQYQLLEEIANTWADSSLMMKEQLSARKIPYFHIIQPNQYYPTARHFSEQERKIAINDRSDFKEAVIKGYPRLLSRIDFLKQHGVNVFSAVSVFDDVKDPVYLDDCCHYNKIGNKVLADFVSQRIVTVLNEERAYASP